MSILGAAVVRHRKARGMSQRELAAAVGRSESWVSQVERGILPVDRLPVLQGLAVALGVTTDDLQQEEAGAAGAGEPVTSLPETRRAITGHPVPAILYGETPDTLPRRTVTRRLRTAWDAVHQHRYESLDATLATLIPALEAARPDGDERDRSNTSQAYQVASAAFASLGEADAAWVAADRALRAADGQQEPEEALAALFRMTHAFISLGRLDQARKAASTGIEALEPRHASLTDAQRSLLGALYLTTSVVEARDGERTRALEFLASARKLAMGVADRNDHGTEFGPTNVQLHEVAVAIELGDFGRAVEVGKTINPEHLSPERQARLAIDMARAFTVIRQPHEALTSLRNAYAVAPELVQAHRSARTAATDLRPLLTARELKSLAKMGL